MRRAAVWTGWAVLGGVVFWLVVAGWVAVLIGRAAREGDIREGTAGPDHPAPPVDTAGGRRALLGVVRPPEPAERPADGAGPPEERQAQ